MVFVVLPFGWALAWVLKWYWGRRFDRLGESTSEEMLEELEKAYAVRRSILIRTPTEYLPFVFEGIREVVDGGCGGADH